MLLEKIDHWEAEIREQALERGFGQCIEQARLEDIRDVLEMRFGAGAVSSVTAYLHAAGGDLARLTRLHSGGGASARSGDLSARGGERA